MKKAKAAAGGVSRAHSADDRLYQLAVHLTERDPLLCRPLYDHRVLTTRQVADVGFGSLRKAQYRLALVHALEVVVRFRLRTWSGRSPHHFTLGAVLAAECPKNAEGSDARIAGRWGFCDQAHRPLRGSTEIGVPSYCLPSAKRVP